MRGLTASAYDEGRDAAMGVFLKHAGRADALKGLFERAKGRALDFGKGQLDAAKGVFKGMHGGVGINMDPDISARAHEILTNTPGAGSLQWDDLASMQRAAHRAEAVRHLKKLTPSLLAGATAYGAHRVLGLKKDLEEQRAAQQQQAREEAAQQMQMQMQMQMQAHPGSYHAGMATLNAGTRLHNAGMQ